MRFTVDGLPCSKNAAFTPLGRRLILTAKGREFAKRVQAAAISAGGHARPWFTGPGIVVITEAHFSRDADAGAVAELVQDALQGIAYVNDRGVLFAGGWKGDPDPENPRTVVHINQLTIGTNALHLAVPVYAWKSEMERRTRDMRSVLPSGTREKLKAKRLQPSRKDYGA